MKKLALDKDFLYTFFNQAWRFVSGPIMLFCIPLCLTPTEQGYWYAFGSLAALSVFANFGFTFIVLQFAAHEYAQLKFEKVTHLLIGEKVSLVRLSTLYVFITKWAFVTVAIVFPLIALYGFYFLQLKGCEVNWQIPWIIYSTATGMHFFVTTQSSFFEGCDSVRITQKINMIANIIGSSLSVLVLLNSGALYALATSVLVLSVIEGILLYLRFGCIIKQFIIVTREHHYFWFKEFTKLLWRYALSWISSYFLVQIMVPMAFYYFGAIEAGKIGFTIAILNAVSGLSRTWLYSITPKLNILVSNSFVVESYALYKKNNERSMITYVTGLMVLLILVCSFSEYVAPFRRLVTLEAIVIMGISWFGQLYCLNGVAFLRAFKEEPLMKFSIAQAFFTAVTTFFCALILPKNFLFLGSMLMNICMGIIVYLTINRRRKEWY